MVVKVKKTSDKAVLPEYQTEGAACFDLVAATKELKLLQVGPVVEYDTHLAFEIPKGYVGLIFPRSSITTKTSIMLGNCIGVIDSDYRGTVKAQFKKTNPVVLRDYEVGDRIAQMMILPIEQVRLQEVAELSDTTRGTGGFGSTGK